MADNLRTRIAAVIHKQNVSEYCGTIHPEDVLRLADAVIRELGLTKEDEYNPYDPFPPPYRVRYVTEWITE